jgi:hypothetical protein
LNNWSISPPTALGAIRDGAIEHFYCEPPFLAGGRFVVPAAAAGFFTASRLSRSASMTSAAGFVAGIIMLLPVAFPRFFCNEAFELFAVLVPVFGGLTQDVYSSIEPRLTPFVKWSTCSTVRAPFFH